MSSVDRSGVAPCDTPAQELSPRKHQPRGLIRLRQLLDAAAALFIAQGVDATTVDEIVASAGVAKGTFYHHFASKAELLAALREDFIATFNEHIMRAVESCPQDDLSLRLESWVKAAVNVYVDLDALHEIVFKGPSEPLRWTASGSPLMNYLVELLAEGDAKGIWSASNPHLIGTLLFRGIIGVMEDRLLRAEDARAAWPELAQLARSLVGYPTGKPCTQPPANI